MVPTLLELTDQQINNGTERLGTERNTILPTPPLKKPTYVIGKGWKLLSTRGQEVTAMSRSERRRLKVRVLSNRQLLPNDHTESGSSWTRKWQVQRP